MPTQFMPARNILLETDDPSRYLPVSLISTLNVLRTLLDKRGQVKFDTGSRSVRELLLWYCFPLSALLSKYLSMNEPENDA